MPVSIFSEDFAALKAEDAFWTRVGADAADPAEHLRVEGEWLGIRGIHGEALRAWANAEAIEDMHSTGLVSLPPPVRLLVGASIAAAYHLGFVWGVEMRDRAQS